MGLEHTISTSGLTVWGLDPDRWFGKIERVTLAHVGMEPVIDVSNIPKYERAYATPLFEFADARQGREDIAFIQPRLVD